MTEPTWLIDKSALARLAHSLEPETWSNRIERGLVHISNVTRLEVGYSTQSGDVARREFRESPLAAMPVEYLTPRIEDRAPEIQLLLAIAANTAGRRSPTSSSRNLSNHLRRVRLLVLCRCSPSVVR